jgi:hypothetical protein
MDLVRAVNGATPGSGRLQRDIDRTKSDWNS